MLRRLPWLFSLVSLSACSPTSSPDAPATTPDAASSAVAVSPRASATAVVSVAPVVAAPTASVAAATASASSAPLEVTPPPTPSPVATTGPVPSVKVANIGIHIGGGPNDAPTKEPFKKSVFPHHDELRRCWGSFGEGQTGDMSIELKVEREGGKARVKPNKSTFKNREMTPCVIAVFESIDFLKPRTGTTVLNYAIRFTPEK